MKPKRNAVRLLFSIEDAARIPGLESALTRDLRMALVEGVDRAIFLGDATATGTDADIVGLQTAAITETTITQANKILVPGTLSSFTGLVDGIHAMGLSDLNVVASVGAWRLWENTIINSTADNMTLAAFLRMAGLSWMARGEIEAATLNNDFGAFIGRGMGNRRGRGRCGLGSGRADPRSVQRRGERRGRVDALLSVGFCLAAHGEFRPNQIRDVVGPAMTAERRPAATELRVEGRKLSGTVMRYGEISPSHRERFEPGSLRMAESVHLDLHHDIERAVAWHPGGGLVLDNGRDALTMRAELPPDPRCRSRA